MKNIIYFLTLICLLTSLNTQAQKLIPFENKNEYWGYKNEQGDIVIPAKFDFVYQFQADVAVVSNKGLYGLIDKKGQVTIPIKYANIEAYQRYSIVTLGTKQGLIANKGKIIIPIKYQYIKVFSRTKYVSDAIAQKKTKVYDDLVVKINNRYGIINEQGKQILPTIYDDIDYVSKSPYNYRLKRNDQYSILDENRRLQAFGNNKPVSLIHHLLKHYQVINNEKRGIVDAQNRVIIPIKYDHISRLKNPTLLYQVYLGKLTGILNDKRDTILPIKYTNIKREIRLIDGYELTQNAQKSWINRQGKILIPPLYKKIEKFVPGILKVASKTYTVPKDKTGRSIPRVSNKVGLIDTTGKVIVPLKYHKIDILNPKYHYFKVENDGQRQGIINRSGKVIIPLRYHKIQIFKNTKNLLLFIVTLHQKQGIINQEGKVLLLPIYDQIQLVTTLETPLFVVAKGKKQGIINLKGKVLLTPEVFYPLFKVSSTKPLQIMILHKDKVKVMNAQRKILKTPRYDDLLFSGAENILIMKKNNLYALLNVDQGRRLSRFYKKIFPVNAVGLFGASQDKNKHGFLNRFGKKVTSFEYDDVSQKVGVKKNGRFALINHQGQLTTPFEFTSIKKMNQTGQFKLVRLNSKNETEVGVINHLGEIIIPAKYNDITLLRNALDSTFKVEQAGKYALFHPITGKKITDFIYEQMEVDRRNEALLLVSKGKNQQGVINLRGEEIIPCKYKEVEVKYYNNQEIKAFKDGTWYHLNLQGKILWQEEEENIQLIVYNVISYKYKNWKKYLEQNFHQPQKALKYNIKGKMVIHFKGDFSNIEIKNGGLGYGYNKELLRVLKEFAKKMQLPKNHFFAEVHFPLKK